MQYNILYIFRGNKQLFTTPFKNPNIDPYYTYINALRVQMHIMTFGMVDFCSFTPSVMNYNPTIFDWSIFGKIRYQPILSLPIDGHVGHFRVFE